MYHLCRSTLRPRNTSSGGLQSIADMLRRHPLALAGVVGRFCSDTPKTFDSMMNYRRVEARKSILVQVSSERSYNELYSYCSQFGTIENSLHYRVASEDEGDCHYFVMEFSSTDEVDAAIRSGVFSNEKPGVRTRSMFLWFRAGPKPKLQARHLAKDNFVSVVDGTKAMDEEEIKSLLLAAESVDDQLTILHRTTRLNDLGKRLRFLAVRQVETSLQGMFPQALAYPFGSSVNGYGKMGCDLDLILDLDSRSGDPQDRASRLVYHTKATNPNERAQVQRQLESIGDVLHLFLPGVNSVRRILKARVPIIKYHHEHLDLEIDLTMNNMTGVYMSQLLYLFGQLDARVRPLTFSVRKWAQSVGLTNQAPGYWITNFSLTMLVMYFLQQLKAPVLPSINKLMQTSGKSSANPLGLSDEHMPYEFLRTPSAYAVKSSNTASLEQLLRQFFEFYSQFDFHQRAISLNMGTTILKPDHSPMYIVNPLETVLNVSKNVNLEETELFRIQVRNALWLLESNEKELVTPGEPWGLVSLLGTKAQERITPQMFFTKRILNVKDIFDDPGPPETKEPEVHYKNATVKNHVASIQKATKAHLTKLSTSGNSPGRSIEGTGVKLKRNAKRR